MGQMPYPYCCPPCGVTTFCSYICDDGDGGGGGPAPCHFEITLADFVNDGCSDCEWFNQTFLFSTSGATCQPCEITFPIVCHWINSLGVTKCDVDELWIYVSGSAGAGTTMSVVLKKPGLGFLCTFVRDDLDYPLDCLGMADVNFPLHTDNSGSDCDLSSATCTVSAYHPNPCR